MRITMDQVAALKADLATVPPPPPRQHVTKQEAIRHLGASIAELRRKGYTFDGVAELLSKRGISITSGTLRSYLRRLRPGHRRKHIAPPSGAVVRPSTRRSLEAPKASSVAAPRQGPGHTAEPRVQSGRSSFTPREDSDEI